MGNKGAKKTPDGTASENSDTPEGRGSARSTLKTIVGTKDGRRSVGSQFGVFTSSRVSAGVSEISAEGGRILDSPKFAKLSSGAKDWFKQKKQTVLDKSLAFIPWALQQSYHDRAQNPERSESSFDTMTDGALIQCYIGGFKALITNAIGQDNGAQVLAQVTTKYYEILIEIISAYRGDVLKFIGDGLTVFFPAVDDTQHPQYDPVVPPHGSYGLRDLGPLATAVLRACACSTEIHRRLHMYDTGVDDLKLCCHIGIGCGEVVIVTTGDALPNESQFQPRHEWIVAGQVLEQLAVAEPSARAGETCLSPQCWKLAFDWAAEGRYLGQDGRSADYHIIDGLNPQKYTFPCVRNAAEMRDAREGQRLKLTEFQVVRNYIPFNVFKQIEFDTLSLASELRTVSTIFVSSTGADFSCETGAGIAKEIVADVNRVCHGYEGVVNKIFVDYKGLNFFIVFGLPPLVHPDDPSRAARCALDVVVALRNMSLMCQCGVTTGLAYCGIIGSSNRMEFAVLGDSVNQAVQLAATADANVVLVDEETQRSCEDDELTCTARAPLKPMMQADMRRTTHMAYVEEEHQDVQVFQVQVPKLRESGGVIDEKRLRSVRTGDTMTGTIAWPWKVRNRAHGGKSKLLDMPQWKEKDELQYALEGKRTKGGLVLINGNFGEGVPELTEHAVMDTASKLNAIPVFSSQDCFPGMKIRPLQHILRSLLMAFRQSQTLSDFHGEALSTLAEIVEGDFTAECWHAIDPDGSLFPQGDNTSTRPKPGGNPAFSSKESERPHAVKAWYRNNEEDWPVQKSIDFIKLLMKKLLEDNAVTCVLTKCRGTNLNEQAGSDEETVLWTLVQELCELAVSSTRNPLLVVVSVEQALDSCPGPFAQHLEADCFVRASPLADKSFAAYCGKCLEIQAENVPEGLLDFAHKLTLGNACFTDELMEHLMSDGLVSVVPDIHGENQLSCDEDELAEVNVAAWTDTSMIGHTSSMLNNLDVLQKVILKIATTLLSGFTVADLSANLCPRWTGVSNLDTFRIYSAASSLHRLGIIDRGDACEIGLEDYVMDPNTTCFRLRSMLIRKVTQSSVFPSLWKNAKCQALMDRVVLRDLPMRLEHLRTKKAQPHIPWYYQVETAAPADNKKS